MKKSLMSLIISTSALANVSNTQIHCHDYGGGYVESGLNVAITETEVQVDVLKEITYDHTPGLQVEGVKAKRAVMAFPRNFCIERIHNGVPLLSCGNGFGDHLAEIHAVLTLIDGTQKRVLLNTNVTFELRELITLSSHNTEDILQAQVRLIEADDTAMVGFRRESACKVTR